MAPISEEEYPSNSFETRSRLKAVPEKEEVRKLDKVDVGRVTRKKPSLSQRFKETFAGDNGSGVFEYLAFEIIIPAFKDLISDAVQGGIERLMFGESRPPSRRGGMSRGQAPGSYTNYSRYSTPAPSRPQNDLRRPDSRYQGQTMSRTFQHKFEDLVLDSRAQAEEVLDSLLRALNRYETVSVSDLYDIVGINGEHTDEKWGWRNLDDASIVRIREGFQVCLPSPEPLSP